MPVFEATNYMINNVLEEVGFADLYRYRKPVSERRGFLRNEQPQNTVNVAKRTANRRDSFQTRRIRAPLTGNYLRPSIIGTSRQKGIADNRRNNELSVQNNTRTQRRAAIFRRTLPGKLAERQLPQNTAGTQQQTGTLNRRSTTLTGSQASSWMNRAVQQYRNLNSQVRNTNDLIRRGVDTYRKTRRLNPMTMKTLQKTPAQNNQPGLKIPPTKNYRRSRGMMQYIVMNSSADKSTNTADLYLKAGPKRMFETQLFI